MERKALTLFYFYTEDSEEPEDQWDPLTFEDGENASKEITDEEQKNNNEVEKPNPRKFAGVLVYGVLGLFFFFLAAYIPLIIIMLTKTIK